MPILKTTRNSPIIRKKSAFKKSATKKARTKLKIKNFVDSFYREHGEMMSKLSHE
jgi:hypothetical protein